ncbi:hypothetical protein L9F63_006906, partial [Diploptera punctata]
NPNERNGDDRMKCRPPVARERERERRGEGNCVPLCSVYSRHITPNAFQHVHTGDTTIVPRYKIAMQITVRSLTSHYNIQLFACETKTKDSHKSNFSLYYSTRYFLHVRRRVDFERIA